MFSFFKKKPPAESEGERSAPGWWNADVGELLFGKKPADVPPAAPPTAAQAPASATFAPPSATPAPAAAPPASTAAPAAPARDPSLDVAAQSAAAPGGEGDRAGWLAKLKSGLQRTGGAIASAFVGAEIGDELYEDLEVALLQADAGADATIYLLDQLQARVTRS
ncbi:MAG: signal recognition particle receptor subunit alpha, partial [Caldimonas sp.]